MEAQDDRIEGAGGPVEDGPVGPEGVERHGIAGLSRPYQVVAALVLACIGVLTAVHLAMVFLAVAPSNTVSKEYGTQIDDYVLPEFERNWKLFAPNPLQQNVAVQARAEIQAKDGSSRTTSGWVDLSAKDGAAIRGNAFPSHVDQNELRRGWDFFVNSHDANNQAIGDRGRLSERYIRRIVLLHLGETKSGGTIERIQVRSATTTIAAPPWSAEKVDTKTYYRVLPWWTVVPADRTETS
ncbi:DUF5819 family protein [Streptomyces sp. NBC_01465]|uniref:DUF5819 family protein n=1 Tax=Streptomyces sp. NBC_01465 TaxID=2903878 RepID=UPI002E3112B0|nr:DUF5819 family protein [Streptomyces sp. NBC_01465]